MEVKGVEAGSLLPRGPSQPRSEIEPARGAHREVADLDAVDRDRPAMGDIERPVAMDVGGEDGHLMPPRHQRLAKPVDGEDRSAVAPGGEVGGNDVEEPHRISRSRSTSRR
jgi:hypothetical protein